MWKKTLIALIVATPFVWANETTTDLNAAKQTWLAAQQQQQQKQLAQRDIFLQLEALVQASAKQGNISVETLQLIERLRPLLADYPLKEEAEWALLKAKIDTKQVTLAEIEQFLAAYPHSSERYFLAQVPFEILFHRQQFQTLIDYAKQTAPTTLENQCRLFGAQFQQLAEQLAPNPEAEQAGNQTVNSSAEMDSLLKQFDQFWRLGWKTDKLPSECGAIEAYWRDKGFKTTEAVQQAAVNFAKFNNKGALEQLILNNQDPMLNQWLIQVKNLIADPKTLSTFAQQQLVNEWNKQLVLYAFPLYIKTLPEQLSQPDFSPYLQWAEKWQLSEEERREWKISYLNRLFDNTQASFQQWRDSELSILKADSLTERRLRMAIWQQSELTPWLALLSPAAKEKSEWRYWLAKSDKQQAKRLLTTLSKERGFYAMLAAHQLGIDYTLSEPAFQPLTEAQQLQFQPMLDRVAELRALQRFSKAKTVWIALLNSVNFAEKLALSDYAAKQQWFDLAVEGTIQAKAWDHLRLRLPNAYSDWFKLHLSDKAVTPSFAMAIARQESAWSPQARSHANAIGLMQLLPTTAAQTAKGSKLPYQGERDLLDPFKNIMLGTAHLAELAQKYANNRILMAAAYNAGARRVEQWLARSNGKLALDEFVASIPFYETRGYVQNVLAYDYYYRILQGATDKTLFYQQEWGSY